MRIWQIGNVRLALHQVKYLPDGSGGDKEVPVTQFDTF